MYYTVLSYVVHYAFCFTITSTITIIVQLLFSYVEPLGSCSADFFRVGGLRGPETKARPVFGLGFIYAIQIS